MPRFILEDEPDLSVPFEPKAMASPSKEKKRYALEDVVPEESGMMNQILGKGREAGQFLIGMGAQRPGLIGDITQAGISAIPSVSKGYESARQFVKEKTGIPLPKGRPQEEIEEEVSKMKANPWEAGNKKHPLSNFMPDWLIPSTKNVQETLDKITGGITSPQTTGEEKAREIGNLAYFFKSPARSVLKDMPISAAKATFAKSASDYMSESFGPMGGIAGFIFADVLMKGGKKTFEALAEGKKSAIDRFADWLVSPENFEKFEKNYDLLTKRGITPTVSSLTDKAMFKVWEARMRQSGYTAAQAEEAISLLQEEMHGMKDALLKQNNVQRFETASAGGRAIDEVATNYEKNLDNLIDESYGRFEELAKDALPLDPKETNKFLSVVRKQKDKINSYNPTDAEKKVIKELDNIENTLTRNGKPIQMDLSKTTSSIRSLNKKIEWDQPGVHELLKPIRKQYEFLVKDNFRNMSPEAVKSWENAQALYQNKAKLFGEEASPLGQFSSRNKDKNLEDAFNSIKDVHELKKIEKAMADMPGGQEAISRAKRSILEDMIGETFERQLEGFAPSQIRKLESKGRKSELFQYLVGKEGMKELKNMRAASNLLEKEMRKFFNASGSGTTMLDYIFTKDFISGLGAASTGNLAPIASWIGMHQMNKVAADVFFNPETRRELYRRVYEINSMKNISKQAPLVEDLASWIRRIQAVENQSEE